jgi:hypothetical protein
MAEENGHLRILDEAQTRAVEARRELARVLGQQFQRGHTENIGAFCDTQALIEAIDRAINDEVKIATEPLKVGSDLLARAK